MSLSVTLLTILSGVCLLLWGLRTIKRAVLRGYGAQVQSGIAKGTKNRIYAFFSGIAVTMCLQSSTATALLASSFVGRGIMTVTAGLAVMIGADVGTSLMTQILSFDMRWLAPLLLSSGIILHLIYDDGSHKRFLARIIMGLGFILTALAIIRTAAEPLAASETLPLILQPLVAEPILAILISAFLTYLMHSGMSAVLLFATFAGSGVLPLNLALTFVIGANVGVALIPMVAVMRDVPQAVQIPLGNIIMRMTVGIACLFSLPYINAYLLESGWSTQQNVIFAHIGYNVILAILFLPFINNLASLCARLSPALRKDQEDQLAPKYLDKKALSSPQAALSCAMRETLHLSEIFEDMLQRTYPALAENDDDLIDSIVKQDQAIDNIYAAVKDYIIRLTREELDDKEADKAMTIMNFATNIEHCGDIVEGSLMDIAQKKMRARDQFSEEGLEEIKSIHDKVSKNLKLAQSIFLSNDPELAKQLLDYKKGLKLAENESAANHYKRLQKGLPATMATTGMHMDVIRDLRRINTYITSVAYHALKG